MEKFVVTISPRYYETDAQGHINNATIAAWFEVVRTRFMQSFAPGESLGPRTWMLASVKLDYKHETLFGDDVELQIIDAKVGNTSLALHCEMWQHGRLTVMGKAVLVHFDQDAKVTLRIPDTLREQIAARHSAKNA